MSAALINIFARGPKIATPRPRANPPSSGRSNAANRSFPDPTQHKTEKFQRVLGLIDTRQAAAYATNKIAERQSFVGIAACLADPINDPLSHYVVFGHCGNMTCLVRGSANLDSVQASSRKEIAPLRTLQSPLLPRVQVIRSKVRMFEIKIQSRLY